MQSVIFIYTTFPSKEQAVTVARMLLEKRLIGCANLHPITSLYRWEGAVNEDAEIGMWCKTVASMAQAACDALRALHPYQVPCIASVPVLVNEPFAAWLHTVCPD
jgi:periplasmic divalent cation tolerance protein